uniref:G protein-activated inward rectifier potassium channel 3 n=1 Tax=Steinernema glaseri TaxID=37863 RepID=A0A1I8A7A3_9BILA
MFKDSDTSSLVEGAEKKKRRFLRRRMPHTEKKIVLRKRLVEKSGYINLRIQSTQRYYNFIRDFYTSLLALKWRYIVLLYFSTMTLMWFLFASVYHMIALNHGDFDKRDEDTPWTPCILNAPTFTDMLIYSFATQSTVGYGYRHMSNECIGVVFSSMMQLLLGTLLHGLITAFVINKLARPTKRTATLMFSEKAVIAKRDGKLCLMIRIGDMRKTCLAEAHVRMQLIRKTITYEGDMLPYHQFEMDIGYKQGLDRVMVMWPITVVHEINEESPLYDLSREELENASTRFEIIVILEGVVESNGSTTQARTSYTPAEVVWGKKFEKVCSYHRKDGKYIINLKKFNSLLDAKKTPNLSAKELDELGTTIHEVTEPPRGCLFDTQTTKSVSIRMESDSDDDDDDSDEMDKIEELPADDFEKSHLSPSANRKQYAGQIRREFDMF